MGKLDIPDFKSKLDIVDVIGKEINLSGVGKKFKGLCPFHKDTHPSFEVDPAKGTFKCYPCGAYGDAIEFVSQYRHLDFMGSVRYLAEKYNINLPEINESFSGGYKPRKNLISVLNKVKEVFSKVLVSTEEGRGAYDYLLNRGFLHESIIKLGLGYAPRDSHKVLMSAGLSTDDLEELDLIRFGSGEYYGYFRERVLFPIFDLHDRCVAFAGRTLDPNEKVKYINSKESYLYKKRKLLYGLNSAARFPNQNRDKSVLVVEGYTDVLMANQFGINNVVALAGVGLSNEQALMLRRFFDKAIIALDPDEAGAKGTLRSAKTLMHAGVNVRVLRLPGKDLDEILLDDGVSKIEELVNESKSLYRYWFDGLLEGRDGNLIEPEEKRQIIKGLVPFLAYSSGADETGILLDETAKRLNIPYEVVISIFDRFKKEREGINFSPFITEQTEFEALLLMMRKPESTAVLKDKINLDYFTDPTRRALFSFFKNHGPIVNVFDEPEFAVHPSLFEKVILPEEVETYLIKQKIEYEPGKLYALLSKLRTSSAEHLSSETIIGRILSDKTEMELGELETKIQLAKESGNIDEAIELLAEHRKIYLKFKTLSEELRGTVQQD